MLFLTAGQLFQARKLFFGIGFMDHISYRSYGTKSHGEVFMYWVYVAYTLISHNYKCTKSLSSSIDSLWVLTEILLRLLLFSPVGPASCFNNSASFATQDKLPARACWLDWGCCFQPEVSGALPSVRLDHIRPAS